MSDGFQFENKDGQRPRAVMVGVQLRGVSDAEMASSLAELGRLAKTLGLEVIGTLTQRRSKLAPGKVVGEGKLKELARWTGGTGLIEKYTKPGKKKSAAEAEAEAEAETETEAETEAAAEAETAAEPTAAAETAPAAETVAAAETVTAAAAETEPDPDAEPETDVAAELEPLPEDQQAKVVLVDHDLTPTQQRNLEIATGAEVHDRTSVILGIFHRHAHTREARLQVEIARLAYLAPRLREGGGGGDRVRGGVGGKGAGESSLELDRRRIRDRIAEVRRELATIEGGSRTRRGRRSDLPTVALVGYTNAGKSSLMRQLTGSEVYVADKLFATLDTTVRVLSPKTEPPILISDTVGFIKKLPHDLVASFRSTLEEAAESDLLLHIIDASDAAFRDHVRVTRDVLGEVGADQSPSWILLNKIDRVDDETRAALAEELPGALQLSAKRPDDIVMLHDKIVAFFLGELEDAELHVPWDRQRVVHQAHEQGRVLAESHDDLGTLLTVRAARDVLARLRAQLG